jgi:hypothetical protein
MSSAFLVGFARPFVALLLYAAARCIVIAVRRLYARI